MFTTLDENHLNKLKEIAKSEGVDAGELKRLYDGMLNSNFEQDLHDIIRENPDYFEENKDDNA